MKPGQACIACHSAQGQRTWSAMGTVYPSLHEPNDCEGLSGVVVELTGANGQVATGTTNSVGNFLFNATSLTKPWTVKVKANGQERAMGGTITTGDCNSCHTQAGSNAAPGRIVAP
jgi:mono/diheme cytochrome c family protein